MDSVIEMFEELRKERPPVYDADQWRTWINSLAPVIHALPTFEARWASVALLADDLAWSMPGMPISIGFRSLVTQLLSREDCLRLMKVPNEQR